MIMIMNQKNSRKRIILLILLIFTRFGYVHRNNITIPFTLSEKNISILTNTSTSTVNKTIKNLQTIRINKKRNKTTQTLTNKKE